MRWLASLLCFGACTGVAGAQGARPTAAVPLVDALATWIALDAPPGQEARATTPIMQAMPGWHRDVMGTLVMHRGSGRPRRVIACGLDQAGYVVSEITADGYLRLHGSGNARRAALWDQEHEGQRIRVLTRAGLVPGVVGVRSTHLWRRRGTDESVATVESFWVDVGARSRADVAAMGIDVLDPVRREWPRTVYGDPDARHVAGPGAGSRAGCAAVASAAQHDPSSGENVYVLSAQSSFAFAGLGAALAGLGEVDSLIVVDPRALRPGVDSAGGVRAQTGAPPFAAIPRLHVGTTVIVAPVVRYDGQLAEAVSSPAMQQLLATVGRLAALPSATADGLRVPSLEGASLHVLNYMAGNRTRNIDMLLATLTNTYGVSGHEGRVRAAVQSALPAWARSRTVVDTAGNLVLAMGPDRDTVVFIAHMDEIGFEVTKVAHDGTVSLRQRGGFFLSLWEGQPALLHLDAPDAEPLPGIFIPRANPTSKQPAELTAEFGLDSAALWARGVRVGASLTSPKHASRLGATRFTARSIDDRVGCASLLLALGAVDPARLAHKVIFVWSTREETGLSGASAVANAFGPSVKKVYAVDTFVSSDSPLESTSFAYAPIGRGAVVRALDNSSVTPPAQTERVVGIARAARIPLQVGTTNGGNDGSMFSRYGAIDVPISWPARYSHSPVETIDLADVDALARLVAALASHSEP